MYMSIEDLIIRGFIDMVPSLLFQKEKNMRLNLVAAALAASALLTGIAAHADQLADIKKKGELVVGVLGTDEPATFIDPKTRQIVGYEVDLVNAIAKKIGVKPVLKQIAVAARIPELQQGHVDLVAAGLTHNKEREAQIDFSLTTFVTAASPTYRSSPARRC
jgi:polar amino acid transport system substrate-binding protein